MDAIEFHKGLKQHCIQTGGCEKCCMRLYCYTPPIERTEYMVNEIIAYLDIENNHTEDCSRSDHCTSDRLRKCPCSVDMSTALGYESR